MRCCDAEAAHPSFCMIHNPAPHLPCPRLPRPRVLLLPRGPLISPGWHPFAATPPPPDNTRANAHSNDRRCSHRSYAALPEWASSSRSHGAFLLAPPNPSFRPTAWGRSTVPLASVPSLCARSLGTRLPVAVTRLCSLRAPLLLSMCSSAVSFISSLASLSLAGIAPAVASPPPPVINGCEDKTSVSYRSDATPNAQTCRQCPFLNFGTASQTDNPDFNPDFKDDGSSQCNKTNPDGTQIQGCCTAPLQTCLDSTYDTYSCYLDPAGTGNTLGCTGPGGRAGAQNALTLGVSFIHDATVCKNYIYGCATQSTTGTAGQVFVNINYDSTADLDYTSPTCRQILSGCTDSTQLGYNTLAVADDGSCRPPVRPPCPRPRVHLPPCPLRAHRPAPPPPPASPLSLTLGNTSAWLCLPSRC